MATKTKKSNSSQSLALGIVFGAAIGLAIGNIALGVGIGISLGLLKKNAFKNKKDIPSEQDK